MLRGEFSFGFKTGFSVMFRPWRSAMFSACGKTANPPQNFGHRPRISDGIKGCWSISGDRGQFPEFPGTVYREFPGTGFPFSDRFPGTVYRNWAFSGDSI